MADDAKPPIEKYRDSSFFCLAAAPQSRGGDIPSGSLPLEEDQLGAEGRPHGGEDAIGAGLSRVNFEIVLKNGKNGGGGEISDLPQTFPGRSEGVRGKIEGVLHRLKDLGAAGVEDPGGDVVSAEIVVSEKTFDILEEVFFDDTRNVGRENDLESSFDDIPAHNALGIAVEGGSSGENAGAAVTAGELGFRSGDDDGGGSVTEEAAGDKVGNGLVVVLPGERAELHREKKGVVVWESAHIVGGTGDSGCSSDAAQTEDGSAFDVNGKGKTVDEAGIDGGAGDSCHGGKEDGGDLLGRDFGVVERAADGLLAEFDGGLDPGVVGFAEGVEGRVVLERKDDMTVLDTAVGMKAGEEARFFQLVLPAFAKGLRDDALVIAIGGISCSDRCNMHEVRAFSRLWL
jgi:hypothetical protein